MQQALDYATTLDIPFVFSSNGDGFLFHDRTRADGEIERELALSSFPSPAELWAKYRAWKGLNDEAESIVLQAFHDDGSGKEPRYYQRNAINATIEAIAKGQNRILLVMATGTGKTYTAFQIIWRLWKAGRKKRVLFLADRNVLVDQTMVNDFRPFGPAMAKLSTGTKTIEREDGTEVTLTTALDKKRRIDSSYEIYLGLYQAITGSEERQKLFREFSPGFFDLIVIDECHRGSAAEDSAWREILEYFASLDDFLTQWNHTDRKQVIIDELAEEGLLLEPLAEEVGKDLDPFDLICHIAFDQPPLTRKERAQNVRKHDVFTKYGKQACAVLEALLQKYQDEGVTNLDDLSLLRIAPFTQMGTPIPLVQPFGGKPGFEKAVHELQSALYAA